MLRGTRSFPFGTFPPRSEIPTFLSYAVEKKLAKHPEEFGKGAIEGVAGPEAANNAASTGTMVPLLTLGLPTSATAAILLSAFQQYGLQPGPLLFESNSTLVWGLIALYIAVFPANVNMAIHQIPFGPAVPLWVLWARLPLQLVLIAWAWAYTRPEPTARP